MKYYLLNYPSILHYFLGFRHHPLTPQRAREILRGLNPYHLTKF